MEEEPVEQLPSYQPRDMLEGTRAFLAKRAPRYEDR